MKIWNMAPEELKFNIKSSLKDCKDCDFTCLLFIEVCGVLDHNSYI